MTETVATHIAAIADFVNGDLIVKSVDGEKLIISLGPAQVISIKRGLDSYVAMHEASENANKKNVGP